MIVLTMIFVPYDYDIAILNSGNESSGLTFCNLFTVDIVKHPETIICTC